MANYCTEIYNDLHSSNNLPTPSYNYLFIFLFNANTNILQSESGLGNRVMKLAMVPFLFFTSLAENYT